MSAENGQKGTTMAFRDGAVVVRYTATNTSSGFRTCKDYETHGMDHCLGIVQNVEESTEEDIPEVQVKWLQVCKYHRNNTFFVEWVFATDLWEIGQMD